MKNIVRSQNIAYCIQNFKQSFVMIPIKSVITSAPLCKVFNIRVVNTYYKKVFLQLI